MSKAILVSLFAVVWSLLGNAQVVLSGSVLDSATRKPVPKANVMLMRAGKTVRFTQSDNAGKFRLVVPTVKNGDELQATRMGYDKKRQPIVANGENCICIAEKSFQLNEVVVNSGPVIGRKDTVVYDLTKFANGRDNTLKDVLKKLPGVDVAKSGEISYNGRRLDRFTVEGLDLSNGRYNQLTENIKAKDVKKAEVVEHDQPIKALRHKVPTDNVAMNVVLKDSVRDKFSFTLTPYIMVGKPTHVAGAANAMQIGKKKQMMYHLNYDRSGKDIMQGNLQFYSDYGSLQDASLPVWYSMAALATPIDARWLRFNTSQHYGVNLLTKDKKERENRVTVSYTRNVMRQRTANSSLYYLGEQPISTTEKRHLTLTQDVLNMDYTHKINNENSYGNITLKMNGEKSDALSLLESSGHGSTVQRTRLPQANVSASIYKLYSLAKSTLSWKSIADYHHSRNRLSLDTVSQLSLTNNLWHTAHQVSWMKKGIYFTQNYLAEVEVQNLNVLHSNTLLEFKLSPSWRYERRKWILNYYQMLHVAHYHRQHSTFILPTSSFYANFKKSNRMELFATLSYNEYTDDWSSFALDKHQNNYRTFFQGADFVPKGRSLSGSLSMAYKRPIYEFFANAKVSAYRSWRNAVLDMTIVDGNYLYSHVRHNTGSRAVNGEISVSKGFYDLHLKTSLAVNADFSRGESYSQGKVQPYDRQVFTFMPVLSFYPLWLHFDYEGNFSFNRSRIASMKLNTLFNWTQRFTLTSTVGNVDLTLATVCYHNEILKSPSVNTLLADVKAVWRLKKVKFTAELRNLFDKQHYAVTSYSGVGNFTNHYELRPREFLFSAQFSL